MSGLRMIVCGYLVRFPVGGLAWHYLQYAAGLADLGHDVYYVEDSDDFEGACYDPSTFQSGEDPTYGLGFTATAMRRAGLSDRWAYYDAFQRAWRGPKAAAAMDIIATADVLINIDILNPLRSWHMEIPHRVALDGDPGFTQVRNLTDPKRHELTRAHNVHFTTGEAFGTQGCRMPDDGFNWLPARQPVVLSSWPDTPGRSDAAFTTVMKWDSYSELTYEGVTYGLKSRSFEPYLGLPELTTQTLEVALGSKRAKELLRTHGWKVSHALKITLDPWTFQSYIQQSKGEFSVAKDGYVVSRSGWFGERSAGYLASGRPVVIQDTGLGEWAQQDRGLLLFTNVEEAAARLETVSSDYESHCRAAREIAEEHFDHRRLLGSFLDRIFSART